MVRYGSSDRTYPQTKRKRVLKDRLTVKFVEIEIVLALIESEDIQHRVRRYSQLCDCFLVVIQFDFFVKQLLIERHNALVLHNLFTIQTKKGGDMSEEKAFETEKQGMNKSGLTFIFRSITVLSLPTHGISYSLYGFLPFLTRFDRRAPVATEAGACFRLDLAFTVVFEDGLSLVGVRAGEPSVLAGVGDASSSTTDSPGL